MFNLTPKG